MQLARQPSRESSHNAEMRKGGGKEWGRHGENLPGTVIVVEKRRLVIPNLIERG